MTAAKARRYLRLGVVAAGLAAASALAQQPAPGAGSAVNPQLAVAQTSFEALPEAERKAIQGDLIWAGAFSGAPSGSYGPLTFRAINAFKAGRGVADGLLTPPERQALAKQADAVRQAAGFRLIADDKSGVRIGIPEKLLTKREALPAGSRWQSADGKVTLDISTAPPGGETLPAIFDKAIALNPNNPGRKITYKLLRPDFFVVTGETPTGKFYRRLALGPQGLRGFSIGYDKSLGADLDRAVIAIAGSFDPFPSGPVPPAPSATAQAAPMPSSSVLPPVTVARPTERYGVALGVSGRFAVTAAAAIEGCKGVRVAGKPVRVEARDDASGLALLALDGGGVDGGGLRAEPLADREAVVLVAYGDDAGRRAAMALPGQVVLTGAAPAIFAPLQPGQAGSPVFDRQGRLAGLVTANPSDKVLVAGIAPQRAYRFADAGALKAMFAKAGVTPAAATEAVTLSTGAVIDKAAKAVMPVVCGL